MAIKISWRRIAWRLIALSLLFLFPSLSQAATTATLNKVQTSVYKGDTVQLYPTSGRATSWKSSKPSIATVSSSGLVTGIKKGTCTISCQVNGKTLKCTMNVRKKKMSKYVSNTYARVWLNMLGAVESGGMVYGHRDYRAFSGPGALSPAEYSCTAGAYQEYGENLRQLLLAIKKQYPISFEARDTAGIAKDIKTAWPDSHPYKVSPGSTKAKCIQEIIGCNAGTFVQDLRAVELLDEYLTDIRQMGVTNLRAAMFMAECYHLGGRSPVYRVVNRAKDRNSIASLKVSLYKDQKDTSNSYQIGDAMYTNRHERIYNWIKQYISANAKI
ncbi:MAG: Ig-like domain-containing protein [Blautia sp.]|nr:Ig-like domain-containing protein [Blautia sp.]